MKSFSRNIFVFGIYSFFLLGCNVINSQQKGYFSQQVTDIGEPQTDDERTLVGEFSDYLLLADSLSAIWDGTDTLNMRKYIYEIDKQIDCIKKASKFQNVRRSINTHVNENLNSIEAEINQKFTIGLRNEMCEFHRIYYCITSSSRYELFAPKLGERIYKNTLGEYYVMRNHYGEIQKTPVLIEKQYQSDVDEWIPKGH